jgi:capsular exopolysaccharide synthesis family protein
MSHIFDALQRSESERSGMEPSAFSRATELLQAAEKKMRVADRADQEDRNGLAASDHDLELSADLVDQCPTLPVRIRPENHLVSIGKEESLGAEKFRFLAVRLRQLRQTRPLKKILITSTIPQEGKSTIAANLACTLARRKPQRTLLLEGDLRRPTIANRFGLGKVPGLCDWFHDASPRMNIYQLEGLGLWVLPAGNAPENPLELMQSGKLPSLMEQLAGWFDWIVIDSPPVLPLGDTSIWARLADGILLVTRQGVTEKQQLQRGLAALEKSKLLGALVNSSTDAAHSDYYQRYGPYAPSESGDAKPSARKQAMQNQVTLK